MKDCYWCKKSCPDNEEGSFEVDPDDETIELGWICNHCVLAFDGKCDCDDCVEIEKRAQKRLREYRRTHMTLPARMLSYILG